MENSYAYAETLDVLNCMDKTYIDKIPKKLIEFFEINASKDYDKHIIRCIDLKYQNLNRQTLVILAMINNKYWSDDSSKMQQEEIIQEDSRYKEYSNNSIFNNEEKTILKNESLIEIKEEKWYKKIFYKIVRFFIRK